MRACSFDGFVSGDGCYNVNNVSFKVALKALRNNPDHPTLLSFQRLLKLVGISSNVSDNTLTAGSSKSEILSMNFSCFGTNNDLRKVMHLAAAPGVGEPNVAAAMSAARDNEALRTALAETILIGKATTVDALNQLDLKSALALATRENIAWK